MIKSGKHKMRPMFVLLAITAVFNQAKADLKEDEILEKLFTSCEKPTLDVIQTKSYLENLRDIYANEPQKLMSLQGVADYLKVIRLSEVAICYQEGFYAKIEELENLAKSHCNLIQLIEHYKQKYTDRCNEPLLRLYGPVVENIQQTSTELSRLTSSVKTSHGDEFSPTMPFYDDASLVDGIYQYLVELKVGTRLNEEQIRERGGVKIKKFSKLYRSKVKALCDQAGDEFRITSKEILDKIAGSRRVFASFDEKLRSWLYAGSICLDIANKDKDIGNSVYYMYHDNRPETAMEYLFFYY